MTTITSNIMLGATIKYPSKAIANARKNEKKVLELLLINSLLTALAVALIFIRFSRVSAAYVGISVFAASTVFMAVFFASLFFAYVLQIIVNTLGGRGRYSDALASLVFGITAPAAGFFVSSLLLFVPFVGIFLSFLIMALTIALGIATLYRAIKELFHVDMLVSFISVSILLLSTIVSVYSIVILNLMTKILMLG